MRLHVLSDLHLERGALGLRIVDADAVVLAGAPRDYPHQPVAGFDPACVVEPGSPKM